MNDIDSINLSPHSLLKRLTASSRWQLQIGILCFLLLILLTAPFFNFHYFDTPNWKTLLFQKQHLFTLPITFEDSHGEKMAFRLAIPLLAKLLSLDKYGIFIGQVICCLVFIKLLIELTYHLVSDRITTCLFTISCSCCYFVFNGPYDVFGRPDAYPLLAMLLALWARNPLIIGLSCLFATWCDERALLNMTWVYLYWNLDTQFWKEANWQNILLPTKRSAAVLVSGLLYLVGRWILVRHFHFHNSTSDVGIGAFVFNAKHLALSIFASLKGLWLLIILTAVLLYRTKNYGLLVLMSAFGGITILTSCLVFDIDRSMAYGFPILFICLQILHKLMPRFSLQPLFTYVAIFGLLMPVTVWDGTFHYIPSLPLRCLQQIFLS